MSEETAIQVRGQVAEGWLQFENKTPRTITLYYEPWGVGPELQPGDILDVYVKPNEGDDVVTLQIWHEGDIALYANLYQTAIYRNGEPENFTDRLTEFNPLPVPPYLANHATRYQK